MNEGIDFHEKVKDTLTVRVRMYLSGCTPGLIRYHSLTSVGSNPHQ